MKHNLKMSKYYVQFVDKKKTAWDQRVHVSFYSGINHYNTDEYDSSPTVTVSVAGVVGSQNLHITNMKDLRKIVHDLSLLAEIDGLFVTDKEKDYHFLYNEKCVKKDVTNDELVESK
jgi:hypothetical protein